MAGMVRSSLSEMVGCALENVNKSDYKVNVETYTEYEFRYYSFNQSSFEGIGGFIDQELLSIFVCIPK